MRKHRWLGMIVALLIVSQFTASASEPAELPRPSDFATVDIVSPKHGQVLTEAPDAIRVRVRLPGGPVPTGLRLHVALDGRQLDRHGHATETPIVLSAGESDLAIPISLRASGVHTVEANLADFVPFSNRVLVKFGVNPMLRTER